MTATTPSKAPAPPRWLRDNLDSFAIAISVAILMKFFAIEAYQIPTSSMQPTMMGSSEAGIFDRILVDKTAYLIRDPERWEVAVFRYPQRRQQNYVKRIAGIPGDRLQIQGGNVYTLDENGQRQAQPRPESVQEGHWKQIYPARSVARRNDRSLGTAINQLSGSWTEPEIGTLTIEQKTKTARARLSFDDDGFGGLVNHVWDGYDPDVQRAMQQSAGSESPEIVQDARIHATVRCAETPRRFEIGLKIEFDQLRSPGRDQTGPERVEVRFGLLADEDGQARLSASRTGLEDLTSETFGLDLRNGPELEFVHLDDSLFLRIDGEEVQRLAVPAFTITEPMRRSGDGTGEPSAEITIDVIGGGKVTLENLQIDRDLHYTSSSAGNDAVFVIGDGQYFMLGDNTLQSVDSREWESVTVGVDSEGRIVPPDSERAVRRLSGNSRAFPLGQDPDADENPVPIVGEGKIVFEDSLGEVYVLDGEVGDDRGPWSSGGAMRFRTSDGAEPFSPDLGPDRLVPREDILGRPLLVFWRAPYPRLLPIR